MKKKKSPAYGLTIGEMLEIEESGSLVRLTEDFTSLVESVADISSEDLFKTIEFEWCLRMCRKNIELPDKDWELLQEWLNGKSTPEIAKDWSLSRQRVRKRLNRILTALKRFVGEQEDSTSFLPSQT